MKKKFFIYYLAGYPVSGKIIGRISGQISIRYNPTFFIILFLGAELLYMSLCLSVFLSLSTPIYSFLLRSYHRYSFNNRRHIFFIIYLRS